MIMISVLTKTSKSLLSLHGKSNKTIDDSRDNDDNNNTSK